MSELIAGAEALLKDRDGLVELVCARYRARASGEGNPFYEIEESRRAAWSKAMKPRRLPDFSEERVSLFGALLLMGAPGVEVLCGVVKGTSGSAGALAAAIVRYGVARQVYGRSELVERGLGEGVVQAAGLVLGEGGQEDGELWAALGRLGEVAGPLLARATARWGEADEQERLGIATLFGASSGPDAARYGLLREAWDGAVAEDGWQPSGWLRALASGMGATGRGLEGAWAHMEAAARHTDRGVRLGASAGLWGLWEGGEERLAMATWGAQPPDRARLVELVGRGGVIALLGREDVLVVLGALRAATTLDADDPVLMEALIACLGRGAEVAQDVVWCCTQLMHRARGEGVLGVLLAASGCGEEGAASYARSLLGDDMHRAALVRLAGEQGAQRVAARRALAWSRPSLLLDAAQPLDKRARGALDKRAQAGDAPLCPLGLEGGEGLPVEWLELWAAGVALPAGLRFWEGDGAWFVADAQRRYGLRSGGAVVDDRGEQVASSLRSFLLMLSAGVGDVAQAVAELRAFRAAGGGDQAAFEAWRKGQRHKPSSVDKAATRALAKWVVKRYALSAAPTLVEALA